MKRLQTVSLFLVCLGLFMALFIAYSPLSATGGVTFTVNSTADAVDFAPGDGICETANGNGVCTLRAAVQETNGLPGADTIQLPAGTYTLTLPGIDTTAAAGDLDILDDLTIIGVGADQTIIDGNQLDRVIHIVCADYAYPIIEQKGPSICPTEITVSISDVTIRNGLDEAMPGGGGIFNTATLILDNATIRDNSLIFPIGNFTQGGGGIGNLGTLTMTNSIVTNNFSSAVGKGAGLGLGLIRELDKGSETYIADSQITGNMGHGISTFFDWVEDGVRLTLERTLVSNNERSGIEHTGELLTIHHSAIVDNALAGIEADSLAADPGMVIEIFHTVISGNSARGMEIEEKEVTISNSTISNNSTSGNGGGIYAEDLSRLTIINSTIVQNSAVSGGGIYNSGGYAGEGTIINSIISENIGGNCINVVAAYSTGNNIEDSDDCNFTAPGDMQNTDPMLGPLQNNGGATTTHALLPGSPAADAGNDTVCQSSPVNSLDQRRYSRVDQDGNMDGGTDGDPCDIGAYEISAAPTSVQLTGDFQSATSPGVPLIAIGIFIIGLILLIGRRLFSSRKTH